MSSIVANLGSDLTTQWSDAVVSNFARDLREVIGTK